MLESAAHRCAADQEVNGESERNYYQRLLYCLSLIIQIVTHYDVISDVAESMGWKIQNKNHIANWDVMWVDHQIPPEVLIKMHLFQKISHFPGIHVMARKNLLGMSLMEMAKKFNSYDFFPKTWLLPSQFSQFRHQYEKNQIIKTYIAKPEADCQGRGIFLTQNIEQLQNGEHYVVQQYISRPFLIDRLKFDFRVYVLLCGVNPMRLYVYEEGLARFATELYSEPNASNLKKSYIHLTNYAINKKNPKFQYNKSVNSMHVGHKRSLTSIFKLVEKQGRDIGVLRSQIDDILIKTLIVGVPLVSHQYRFCQPNDENRNMCFHILGVDIMLDQELKPYVLEVNHTPSFVTDTPLDYHIKFQLIKDTLTLMNINHQTRKLALSQMAKLEKQNTKRVLYQNHSKQERVRQAQEARDFYQNAHLGRYRKIFPSDQAQHMKTYNQMIEHADKTYFAENNVLKIQIENQKVVEQEKIIKINNSLNKNQMQSCPPFLKINKKWSLTERLSQQLQRKSLPSQGDQNQNQKAIKKAKRGRIGSFVEKKFEIHQGLVQRYDQKIPPISQFEQQLESELLTSSKILKEQLFKSQTSVIRNNVNKIIISCNDSLFYEMPVLRPMPKTLPKISPNATLSPVKSTRPLDIKHPSHSQFVAHHKKKLELIKLRDQEVEKNTYRQIKKQYISYQQKEIIVDQFMHPKIIFMQKQSETDNQINKND